MLRSSRRPLTYNYVYILYRDIFPEMKVCVALARELKVAWLGLYMSAIILSYVA